MAKTIMKTVLFATIGLSLLMAFACISVGTDDDDEFED